MRAIRLIAGAALAASSPAWADAAADIRAAETAWNAAIMAKDMAVLERYMGPEFELTGGAAEQDDGVPRAAWLANMSRMTFKEYRTDVTDVRVMGDMAVANVAGNWTVEMNGRGGSETFLLRDIWVRRAGGWQVVRRYRVDRNPNDPR